MNGRRKLYRKPTIVPSSAIFDKCISTIEVGRQISLNSSRVRRWFYLSMLQCYSCISSIAAKSKSAIVEMSSRIIGRQISAKLMNVLDLYYKKSKLIKSFGFWFSSKMTKPRSITFYGSLPSNISLVWDVPNL